MSERVLFFSPHAGIWQHSFPEALLADALRQAGAELRYVTCNGSFSSLCVVIASRGLRVDSAQADKERVCRACRSDRDWLRYGFLLPGYDLDELLTPADDARVTQILAGARRDALGDLMVDGIQVGRATLYEYLIQHKKSDTMLTEEEWARFLPILANVVRSTLAAIRAFERERPTRLVLYNSLYSVNAAWRAVADARGVPVFTIHAGLSLARRLDAMVVARDSMIALFNRLMQAWPRFAEVPCRAEDLAHVTDHFAEVMRGRNVFAYSAPKAKDASDWRARFGIRGDQRLLVATMSSYDEYVAGRAAGEQPAEESLLFPTQIAWIRSLVAWIRTRPELFLLIRVHPREFPNKREGRKSEHASLLEAELRDLPANARVNWPTDGLSLYDIAEHTDVVLNAWSSVGKELSLLGLPVVAYCPTLLMYAPALNLVATTEASYFAAVDRALAEGWRWERIRQAYRWCVLEYARVIADISDGFSYAENKTTNPLERARNQLLAMPGVRQQRDLWRRPRALRELPRLASLILSGGETLLDVGDQPVSPSAADEDRALRREVGRLVTALYGASDGPIEPGSLREKLTAAMHGSAP